jgi:ADP-ribosylglycohydrolase
MSALPSDYRERVYAGVLGKMIGVYLGRPVENWSYEAITARFGEITGYVHDQIGKHLIVADDDLSGTFRFLRAVEDIDSLDQLTAEGIGQTWRNLLIEDRTILWWGGLGMSTEHTAFERLKRGIPAPLSGAIETNGRTVAEQIGAQIFIDSWAMLCPGDPEKAVHLARLAASVSHDGEAIYGAQAIAAMEAAAFVEPSIDALLDTARALIPADCTIARLIDDVRAWHAADGDWRMTRERIVSHYGYDRYPGHCHIVPNHALILLGLLYGAGSFDQSMLIVNTSGWDTDCNAGNLGCLLGIRGGLGQFDAKPGSPDWLTPVADRLYLTSSDGGGVVTDALTEASAIVQQAHRLSGLDNLPPKAGVRFHFCLPYAVQGFTARVGASSTLSVRNAPLPGTQSRSLALEYTFGEAGHARAVTPTFIQPQDSAPAGYTLMASPTLYAGQRVSARILAGENDGPVAVRLCCETFGADDTLSVLAGDARTLEPGQEAILCWNAPSTGGFPIAGIGVMVETERQATGTVYLDWLTWDGAPRTALDSETSASVWQRGWVNAADQFGTVGKAPYAVRKAGGTGMVLCGTREWADYTVEAEVWSSLMQAGGLAVRVQGLRRYIAVLLTDQQTLRIVERWDDEERILAERRCDWHIDTRYSLGVTVQAERVQVQLADEPPLDSTILRRQLDHGAIGLIVEDGVLMSTHVAVHPAPLTPADSSNA